VKAESGKWKVETGWLRSLFFRRRNRRGHRLGKWLAFHAGIKN